MPKTKPNRGPIWIRAALAAALAGAAAPAFAQSVTVEELTVTGRYGVGPDVRSLSAAVPYDDLDLTTAAGREVLKQRVRDTARDLCGRLGEGNSSAPPIAPSCEQAAVNSARDAERYAFATARSPAYAYLPPDQPYVAPAGPTAEQVAPAAGSYGEQASTITTETVTNGPVPDTTGNRDRYGGPMSNGGRATRPAGN